MTFHHTVFAHVRESWKKHGKKILITTGATTLVVVLVVGGTYGYTLAFDGKIYPGVKIGAVNVGGMTQAKASEAVQAAYNGMLDRGLPVRLITDEENHLSVIDLRTSGSTDPDLVYDLISMNVDRATDDAKDVGRGAGNVFIDSWNMFYSLTGKDVGIETTVAEFQLEEAVLSEFEEYEMAGALTDFEVNFDGDEVEVTVIEGETGFTLDTEIVLDHVYNNVTNFQLSEVEIGLVESEIIDEQDAEDLIEEVQAIIDAAPYTLTHTSESQQEFDWGIEAEEIAQWLYPKEGEDGLELALEVEMMEEFLEEIHESVDVKAQNARFQMEDNKVVEFAGSLNGVTLNEEETLNMLLEELGNEDTSIEVAIQTVEPEITTESVNSLGITEIVGVGTSNFAGSPANRRSNIQHGADKLNGLLIAPGEEFSLVEALSPFTIADGWLPELVIKGDEVKPEVGGGACQFGTTLFRATMNTGLEITQRRNHSLVVSYYDDPSNGNPGTDATIYDPAPDYRFKNDTDNYLLLTTDVDFTTSDMTFTFWGTSDGRKGYYTPPEILQWTGYGATQTKETDSLAPGVRRCQAPHSGAITSFDYIVEYADGEVFEHTYTSTYRSLPQICLVGKSDGTGDTAEGADNDELEVENAPAEEPLDVDDVPAEE